MQITDALHGAELIALVSLLIAIILLFVVAVRHTINRLFRYTGTFFQDFAKLHNSVFNALRNKRD